MHACHGCSLQAGAVHPAHKGLRGLVQPGHDARHSLPDLWRARLHDDVEVQQLQFYLQRQVNGSCNWLTSGGHAYSDWKGWEGDMC